MIVTETVIETDLLIGHKLGLHARPAAVFVRTAQQYHSQVTVKHGEQKVNGKSILGVLSLGVGPGSVVRVRAEGPDAAETVAALSQLARDNFGNNDV